MQEICPLKFGLVGGLLRALANLNGRIGGLGRGGGVWRIAVVSVKLKGATRKHRAVTMK